MAAFCAGSPAEADNGCSGYTPTTGDTVSCSSAYAASASGVQTTINNTGNNNVTVNIDQSAVRSINGSTVGIGSASTVSNAGSLNTQSFFNGYGISFGANGRSKLGGNTVVVTETGSVTTAGGNGDAIRIDSSALTSGANSVTNRGVLTTRGSNAEGISIDSRRSAVTIVNSGSILTSGSTSNGIDVFNTQSVVSIQNAATGLIRSSGAGSNAIAVDGATTITNAGIVCAGTVSGGRCVASGNLTANAISLANISNATRSSITNQSTGTIATGGGTAAVQSAAGGLDVINYGLISGGGPDPIAVAFAQGVGRAANSLTLFGGSSTLGAVAFNLDGTAETLAFSGVTSSGFGNTITGANIIRALAGSDVSMTAASYAFAAGTIEVDGTSKLDITGAIIDRGTGAVTSITKTGAGHLTLSGTSSYAGPTVVNAGTLMLTGAITSDTSVGAGARLRGTGVITGNVANAGIIAPGTQGQIGTLTIAGSYVGNGGTFETRVGGSPEAPVADVLRITGGGATASGTTAVSVTDIGGLGAPTTGDGIQVVDAANGAATSADAFVLAGRVAGGAYEYNLIRGGSTATEQNWYLATHLESPEPPVPPGPGPTPEPEPTYRVETTNYPALPALQRLYTYALVDTLEQRRGALGTLTARVSADESALWGRAGGSFGETYGSGADGIDMSYDFGFLQAGVDAVSTSDGHGGRVDAGVFLGIGTSTTDTSTAADGNTGDATFNAYSVGLYGTWLATSGFYADTLLQATRFSDAAAHSSGNASITTDGWSQSLSLEAGYKVGLGDSASLTPQGQIIAENFTLDGTSDEFGDVSFDNGFAARGRLGLELASNVDGFGTRTDLTLRANVWHVFADNPQTTFSSLEGSDQVSFDANFGTTWLALDAGITTAVTDNASLFANAGYEYGFDDSRQAGTGRLGFAYNW